MKKIVPLLILTAVVTANYAFAQQNPVLNASLHSDSPQGQTLSTGAQGVDMARITLSPVDGDVFINGMYLAAEGYGGLANFTDILVYDTANSALIGSYVVQSGSNGLLQFQNITIGNGQVKTYLLRANLSPSAAGPVRLGISGFTYPTQTTPGLSGFPIYGKQFILPGATPEPTPTSTPAPSESVAPSPTPGITAAPRPFDPAELSSLKDGDIVRADGNTAVFVIKIIGTKKFKRWMISPAVLQAYGIPFSRIRVVDRLTLEQIADSHLMRRFGDAKVYELWDVKEGISGSRRWIPTVEDFTGRGFDFDAVYTINDAEYKLYTEGQVLRAPVR